MSDNVIELKSCPKCGKIGTARIEQIDEGYFIACTACHTALSRETRDEVVKTWNEAWRESKNDNVNSPAHYCKGGMECIEAIRAACKGLDGVEAYYVGNIIKYVWRFKHKNGYEDLRKAHHYLEWLMEKEQTNDTN